MVPTPHSRDHENDPPLPSSLAWEHCVHKGPPTVSLLQEQSQATGSQASSLGELEARATASGQPAPLSHPRSLRRHGSSGVQTWPPRSKSWSRSRETHFCLTLLVSVSPSLNGLTDRLSQQHKASPRTGFIHHRELAASQQPGA